MIRRGRKVSKSRSVVSESLWPHGLHSPCNSPGRNTGVGSLSPGDLPSPGIKPRSPALQGDSLPAEPQGKPKNTGVGSRSLLQQIFPTQESNRGLLHCRGILYQLSHKGSPRRGRKQSQFIVNCIFNLPFFIQYFFVFMWISEQRHGSGYLMLDTQWHYLSCWACKNYSFIDDDLFCNQRKWRVTSGTSLSLFVPLVFPLCDEDDEGTCLDCGGDGLVANSCLTVLWPPWTVAHQAPLSVGFPRQAYWSGLPFPSPGDLSDPGIEPKSSELAGGFFTSWATKEAHISLECGEVKWIRR